MKKTLVLMTIVVVSLVFLKCGNNKTETLAGATPIGDTTYSFTANYYPPDDIDTNASSKALAQYAWQEFLALNWKSSYGRDGKRGHPDTLWSYEKDKNPFPDTVVWETYAHRSELSPFYYPMRPFDSANKYSYRTNPIAGASGASYALFDNVDETSEIGSCNMFAFANRFAGNMYGDTFMVRYQAKCNQTEYDYIRSTFATANALSNAVATTKRYVKSQFARKQPPMTDSMMVKLPNGSIEVKSSWRPLTPQENPARFLTRNVIVYYNKPNDTNFYYTNKTYALIGLHIIHKSKNHPSFVFATWEHVDVTLDSMKYILLTQLSPTTDSLGLQQPLRNKIYPFSDISTRYVHSKLLPATSIWQNYRLVGVQGKPSSNVADTNFFLANYVTESDSLLALFHGSGFSNPFNDSPNVVYNSNLYSAGGCMGCHGGGAQRSGTDFSFIVSSPNTAPDMVAGAPATATQATPNMAPEKETKLSRLKRKFN